MIKEEGDSCKKWKTIRLNIYGKKQKVKVKQTSGLWKAGDYRHIKIFIVRDPKRKTKDQAFYTTDRSETAEKTLTGYAERWSIEVAFQNSKSHFGFEDPQNRKKRAVERTAPMAMCIYSLVIMWFAEHGYKKCKFLKRPWYQKKTTPSFADILSTLRRESAREYFLNTLNWKPGSRKIMTFFCQTLAMAS